MNKTKYDITKCDGSKIFETPTPTIKEFKDCPLRDTCKRYLKKGEINDKVNVFIEAPFYKEKGDFKCGFYFN